MSQNFIVIKVNLTSKLLHVVYIVAIIIVGRMYDYLSEVILIEQVFLDVSPQKSYMGAYWYCSCIIIANYGSYVGLCVYLTIP